jgi:hypothetical protein
MDNAPYLLDFALVGRVNADEPTIKRANNTNTIISKSNILAVPVQGEHVSN